MTQPAPTPDLTAALDFTADDLAANREGRLSQRQRARLRALRRRSLLIGAGILVVLILAATTLLFLGQRNASPILGFIGVAVTVCNAAIMGVLARNVLRLSADINEGKIAVLVGKASRTLRVNGRVATYILKLDGQEFAISKAVFAAFRDGAAYRLYRAPLSRVLLAGEEA